MESGRSFSGAACIAAMSGLLALATAWAAPAGGGGPAAGEVASGRQVDPTRNGGVAFDENAHPGKGLFDKNCAQCHLGGVPKAPHREFLEFMPPQAVVKSLNEGVMRDMAAHLKPEERVQVAEYLARSERRHWKEAVPPVMCTGPAKEFDLSRPPAQAGWGYDARNFTPAEVAKLTAADLPKLKLKWAFGFPGATRARSQPVAAMRAVFVGSEDGTVYAFDLATGCARWTSQVSAEVRTAIVVEPWAAGTKPARNPRLFFGDLLGRVYAMDALTGAVLWRVSPDDHANATITATPLLVGDTLYVGVSSLEVVTAADVNYACCTFRGSVNAIDANTGATKWRHFTVENPPTPQGKTRVGTTILGPSGAPVWTSPVYDAKRGVIYHGSGENYSSPPDRNSDAIFAIDAKTGARRWQYQITTGDAWNATCTMPDHPNCPKEQGPDFDLSASPLLIELGDGKDIVVASSKAGIPTAVDPDTGKLVWQTPIGRGSIQGGTHFGIAAEGTRVYVPITDMNMDSMGRPFDDPGAPGMHAVDARTGQRLWSSTHGDECRGRKHCDPGISAAATAIPGMVLAGAWDGYLRAYDGATGEVLWAVDTTIPVKGTNGEIAQGGSIGGPGPLVIDGHVIINSGYAFSDHMPGNAFLVYSIDGR